MQIELENRIIKFVVDVLNLVEKLPAEIGPSILSKQLIRSSTSSALNYGEAQAAESKKDFIHKMRIC